jgi:dCMP deaminase
MTADREKQIERDRYYMAIALAVKTGANCLGTHVGALLVVEDRVITTGYNGTPSGFRNCDAGGCVRCHDSHLKKTGRQAEMTDQDHVSGAALDRCICVHAEQNAFNTAAKFGIAVKGATLYTTSSPCFGCLKEALQVGVQRVVYNEWYPAKYSPALQRQYRALYMHLADGDPMRFEMVGGATPPLAEDGQPDSYASKDSSALTPPDFESDRYDVAE